MFDGGAVCVIGVIAEVGDLVSCIGYFASHALLREVDISGKGAVVELMVEGRR